MMPGVDAVNVLAVHIATEVFPAVYYQTALALLVCLMSECCSEESCANYKVVVFHYELVLSYSCKLFCFLQHLCVARV